MAGHDPAVRLAEGVEPGHPGLEVGAGRDAHGDEVEAGERCCPLGVMPCRQGHGPGRVAEGDTHQHPVLHELDVHIETEDSLVSVSAADDVANWQLDVVETAQRGHVHLITGYIR